MVRNHPFQDGNEHTARVATPAFVALIGGILTATDGAKFHLLIDMAQAWGVGEVDVWLRTHLNVDS